MIELQETFNTVAKHLFEQNARAMNENKDSDEIDRCLYKAPDGKKCAVGCLIPDDEYDEFMETTNLSEVYEYSSSLQEHDLDLLGSLQSAHDNSEGDYFWDTCRRKLLGVTEKHKLNATYLYDLGAKS